ncbi:hypothetical protein PGT21_035600 [Puccinia graminis f. sp. tritici]|uniref:Uncharacterized protein n=1 Tax=Puccinia graminis f. sp. tritici TaxID=56615 RepID=A0A5B0MK59_PUCGR|nr:hypothetical protein PGTUg99_036928 [Puccinia graminis f. sp. tritici]KAA1091560.1 hypothetical protein PGT21_035600 [Puccinia graminis f. sp. tritici]
MNKGRMKEKGQGTVSGYDVDRHQEFGSGNIIAGYHRVVDSGAKGEASKLQ